MNTPAREIDVGELLENRKLGRFHAVAFLLCFLILFVDGLDYSAANVGAPAILRAFNADRAAMGTVLVCGYIGIFIGSVVFGIVGDRYGRRVGAILGVLAYSLPALLTPLASSLDEVTVFRFLAGIGIGGVVPNTIALLTETAPKRLRVSAVMAGFVGYSLGNATIGQVAAWFTPAFGWSIVFLVAGVAGTILSFVLLLGLPESIPFLAATKPDSPRLPALVKRAAPELPLSSESRFVLRRPANETKFSLALLFSGYRRYATPLLWIAFFAESLTYMTLSAWFAVILEAAGLAPTSAALVFSYSAIGGIFAILILGRLIDRVGPKATVLSAVIAVSAIIYLGTPGLSPTLITALAIGGLACAAATHQSLNGIVGGFYPTIIRGNAVGYATGAGRVAAIIGPGIVAGLFAAKLPLSEIVVFIAAPDLVVAAACVALDRLQRSRLMIEDSALPVTPLKQPA